MAMSWRKGILFVAGVALGAAAGVVGVLGMRDGSSFQLPTTHIMGGAPAAAPAAAPASAALVKLDTGECDLSPILPKKGSDDGTISLQPHPAAGSASEVASILLTGKEADASGRQRDAEVAFLNACHTAALVQGDPIPLADAMYQLARHYANSAAFGAQPAKELYARAEHLYSASLLAYQARLGPRAEKTKFAAEGLKTVQQVTGHSGPVTSVAQAAPPKPPAAPAPAPTPAEAPAAVAQSPAPAAPAVAVAQPKPAPAAPPVLAAVPVPAPAVARAPAPARVAKAPPAVQAPQAKKVETDVRESKADDQPAAPSRTTPAAEPAATTPETVHAAPVARHTNPSFDCARAHSVNERLICSDEDLARQDRELGRLHARARQAAADPRAFQRASDAEWAQREQTCHDRECLERWYARRRTELAAAAAAPHPAPVVTEQQGSTTTMGAEPRRHEPRRVAPIPATAAADGADEDAAPPPPPRRLRAPEPPAADGDASPGTASGSVGTASGSAGDSQ